MMRGLADRYVNVGRTEEALTLLEEASLHHTIVPEDPSNCFLKAAAPSGIIAA